MYLDKNKHITFFLSFPCYCVNGCDVFTLLRRVHFSSSLGLRSLHYFMLGYTLTSTCSTNPLALGIGFSHFSSKGSNYSISSPKDSNQILTTDTIPEPYHFFLPRRKVHDSNGCVHSLHMGGKKPQAMTCELELRIGAALANMTTQFLPLKNKYYRNRNKTIKDIQSFNI